MIDEISCQELKKKVDDKDSFILLDVGEDDECETCHLENSHLMPLDTLSEKMDTLDKNKEIVVYCKMGGRSAQACLFLKENGFKDVKNLAGGIRQWALEIDTSVALY